MRLLPGAVLPVVNQILTTKSRVDLTRKLIFPIFAEMFVNCELQSIISGNGTVRNGSLSKQSPTTLEGKKEAVSATEKKKFNKKQETQILPKHIHDHNLWYTVIDNSKYIGEGAEQKIYESSDPKFILKCNDSIFYENWIDYFNSLLLHNYFFPHLAYELLGFHHQNEILYAVVKQPYIKSTENTDLRNVKEFLTTNGFINQRNNDYFHPT